ncbi:MAG TPA: GNAT family N-acetyltransferase [Candidatus Angelobacter sp.]|nr:GNAT family N-acetyltransferase [Candidatus Angelobacter sp.]
MTRAVDLRMLPYRGTDAEIEAIARLTNQSAVADEVEEFWTVDSLRAWLAHASEQFDPARDVVLVEDGGEIVATGRTEWVDTRDGAFREYRHNATVHPDHRGRGIGTAILLELERRQRALAATHAQERPTVFMTWAPAGRSGEALLRSHGYQPARWFIDMLRPTLEGVDELPLPAGLELRPVTEDQHETIWRANREAFRDHWGGSDESLEQLHRILDDPDTDPELWLVAWDGAEVAGGVWNEIRTAENEQLGVRRGWLESVFTRRPWRRRGLARALIGRSLSLLRERGMTSAMLGVDADNPTGALGLYEAAGFTVHDRFVALRKPMGEA